MMLGTTQFTVMPVPQANHDAWPKPRDIAASYVFLASPDAGLVNGAAIPV